MATAPDPQRSELTSSLSPLAVLTGRDPPTPGPKISLRDATRVLGTDQNPKQVWGVGFKDRSSPPTSGTGVLEWECR